jgi:hypothetical protein
MALPNIFTPEVTNGILQRIDKLTPATQPQWGKMSVGQMLAHCNVTYEMIYDNKHEKPTGLMKFFLKNLIKNVVVGEKPYKKNSRTAPAFLQTTEKDFSREKEQLKAHITRTQQLGQEHFNGKESHSFGKLSGAEWNNMFYKHLDHHLTQFGA